MSRATETIKKVNLKKTNFPGRNFFVGFSKKIGEVVKAFSITEKVVFGFLIAIFSISTILLLIGVNQRYLVEVPARGGILHEAVVGTPRFINPLIAVSGADRDLTALIYSGLMRRDVNGTLQPDLASRYEISDDGLEYRFFLREDLKFHDGHKITTDDVIFTILDAQDPTIESPRRADWDGIVIERISETEIVFRLKEARGDFLEKTTLGILPRHLWENIVTGGFSLSKFNTEPIGSGPYELVSIRRDATNIPTTYTLRAFDDFALGRPYINRIVIHFATNEDEVAEMFRRGDIDSMSGIKPSLLNDPINVTAIERANLLELPLPRVFGIFLNQNEAPALADRRVREALDVAVPKQKIIDENLGGFAEISSGPYPDQILDGSVVVAPDSTTSEEKNNGLASAESPDSAAPSVGSSNDDASSAESRIAAAKILLEDAGWKKNENGIYMNEEDDENILLAFTVSTSNVPELVAIAERVVEAWGAVGAQVDLKVFEIADLNQQVIRPRNFEALLFGMIVEDASDLYAFWHSSQRNDPGLNITGYANITTDGLLEKLRSNLSLEERRANLITFNQDIVKDRPAIFLYTPKFIYILPKDVGGMEINHISNAQDRFMNVHKWFIDSEKVWKIFAD